MLESVSLGPHSESLVCEVLLRRLSNDEVNPMSVSVMCTCEITQGGDGIS